MAPQMLMLQFFNNNTWEHGLRFCETDDNSYSIFCLLEMQTELVIKVIT
jgi:hypothetical protein